MRVQRAAVVGGGAMGAGIAGVLAFNGHDVVLLDVSDELVRRGLDRVTNDVKTLVSYHAERASKEVQRIRELGVDLTQDQVARIENRLRPKVSRERGEEIVRRVHGTTSFGEFEHVDFVVEAVFEDPRVKREVLETLDRVLPDHAIVGSNTSSLSVTRLSRGLGHVGQILVTHFFNPPTTSPLVEVAAGVDTREDVVADVMDFLQGLRNHRFPLVPIRVKESPAFVVNRLLAPVLKEACTVLDSGVASARDIDLAMKTGAGLPMGPFELADFVGLDIALEVAHSLFSETGDPRYAPPVALRRLVDAGHLGRKTGSGFYEYPEI